MHIHWWWWAGSSQWPVSPSGNYNYPHLGVCWGVCYTSIYSKLTITKSFSSLTTLPNVSMHPKSVIVTSPQSQIVTSACKTRGDCMVLEMSWVIGFLATKSGSAIGSMRWAQVWSALFKCSYTPVSLLFLLMFSILLINSFSKSIAVVSHHVYIKKNNLTAGEWVRAFPGEDCLLSCFGMWQ